MLAISIFSFIGLALASLYVELRYVTRTSRLISYIVLMVAAFCVTALHYQRLSPMAVVNRLEIEGQYFPTDATIRISGDTADADFYSPSLMRRGIDEEVPENPSLEISHYDDRASTLQVVARGMAQPLWHNDEVVNIRPLGSDEEIAIGSFRMKFENGLLSRSRFVVGGEEYPFAWPVEESATTIGELLCRSGLGHEKQFEALRQAGLLSATAAGPGGDTNWEGNPLDHLWVVRKNWQTIGLVNGSAEAVTVNGSALPPESGFTIRKNDRLIYGTGRSKVVLTVDVDPTTNRIYVIPERPITYPLYHPEGDGEAEVFIASAPTITSPAYQISLGERNRDLVRGAIRYKLDGGGIREYVINSGIELRSFKTGEIAALGTSAGGVLLRLTDDKMSRWRPLLYIGVVWLVVGVVFFFLGGVGSRNYLFVLLPLVQMLLSIRLILSYRGYVLPPYYEESYEKSLFALIFVPFAIFLWLYLRDLSAPFDMSGYVTGQRKLFGLAGWNILRTVLVLPPFLYLVISCFMLWLVGAASAERLGLFVGFFVFTVLVAWFLSQMRNWTLGTDPLLSWLSNESRLDIWLLFLVPVVLPLLLRVIGAGTEEIPFTGLRAELLYMPCLFFGACRFYMWFFQEHSGVASRQRGFLSHLWLVLPLAVYFVQAWLVGDWGSLIYSVPVFFLAIIVAWKADPKITAGIVVASAALLVVFFWTPLLTQAIPSVLPGESTVEYRFLAYQNPGWLQEAALGAADPEQTAGFWQRAWQAISFGGPRGNACRSGSSAARRVLGIHEHFWTMFHFASRGMNGVGYGESPVERVPFPDGIAQSDNVYSLYVMSEHGAWGAISLVSLYVFLALLLLFILTQHFGNELEPTLVCGGLAMTILFAALYHASGNVNGVPFTGKNFPLLSLNSTSDVLLIGLLLAAAFSVIANGRDRDLASSARGTAAAFLNPGNMLNRWLLLLALIFGLVFFPTVCVWTVRAANDTRYRGEYDLEAFVDKAKQYIADGVIELDPKEAKIIIKSEQATGLAERQYLRLLRDQFNNATPEEKRSGKYFFIISDQVLDEDVYGPEGPRDRYRERVLTVDQNYFKRPSPFADKVNWHGALLSGEVGEGEQGYLAGEGINLFMQHVLDSDDPVPGVNSEVVATVANPGPPAFPGEFLNSRRFKVLNRSGKHLFDLYAIEADTVLEPHSEFTFVNGQAVRDKTRLEPGDIIAIKGSPQTSNRNLVFAFHRESAGTLAKSHWRNGRTEFTFPQGEAFGLARPIAEAINTQIGQMAQSGHGDDERRASTLPLKLSLDARLNRRIYELLVGEAEGQGEGRGDKQGLWQEVNGRRGLPPRLAVTAMNPLTGEVLALASWPSFDPNPQPAEQETANPRSYTNLVRSRDPESKRYLLNHNFTRHVIGSATKPLIASAAACAYPQLLTLNVEDRASFYDQVLGIPTPPAWQSGAHGLVDWNQFLVKSDNLYAVTIGFMGLANGNDRRINFTNQRTPQSYRLDEQASNLQPDFNDIIDPSTGDALRLDDTPLANWLADLFDVRKAGPDAPPMSDLWADAQSQSLLPAGGQGLAFISPEVPNLALNNVRSARQFVGVCLGGSTNLWSNVKSAEAFSRLVTGRRVKATLVRREGSTEFEKLPADFDIVRPPLLDALEGVGRSGGTAAALVPVVNAINGSPAGSERFTVFAKTGTLEGQYRSGRNDSNIILAAGFYDHVAHTLRRGVVLSVFIEEGNSKGASGRATQFAVRLLKVLNDQFGWNRDAFK